MCGVFYNLYKQKVTLLHLPVNDMISYEGNTFEVVPISEETTIGKKESIIFAEQFVQDVCDFSSQYGSNISISYTGYNIAGKPSKFPDYGDFPQAFVMRTYGPWWDRAPSRLMDYMPQNNEDTVSQDYIVVEYNHEVYPIRVSVYETYNPGSVIAIWAQDCHGQWFQLWNGPPQIVPHKPRIFSPRLQLCNFKTKTLRLEFNHSLLDYYTELDAVLLIGTTELIIPNDRQHNQNLSNLLQELSCIDSHNEDIHNLTPDYSNANQDLAILKKTLHTHCTIYKSKIIENFSKSKLISKLGQHYRCIPPVEEAFNSLQQFLQEEFPKLIKDIYLSSSSSLYGSKLSSNKSSSSALSKSKEPPCGSFSALPDETVLKILKNLDLKSLCRLCRVNKHFNNIARDALLYTCLNLKPYWHCLDTQALNNLAPRCQYLRQLDLSWCGNYNMFKYQNIVSFLNSCGSLLTHLRLNCCHIVNDIVIYEVSKICKNLKELCLRNCEEITSKGFSRLENLEFLERLELYGTTIETATLCSILRRNPRMRHLNVAGMHDRLNVDEVAVELGNSCPYLESVDFWKAQTFTPHGLRALARCKNLREVDFGWCGGMGAPGDSLRALLSSCQHLEKVFLAALRGLTDRDLEPLLLCQHLQQLDLLGARSLTPDICYGFLLCCPKLEMIDLSFCESISDSKIQEWRQQYPHVSVKRSFQAIKPI
ncbi:PREDICTED: F-box/LRR-repeat protein 4 isoform X1 [Dinoponera quadriceps]|uniref:F-box/LRR-repeat protein 4 isoform X1 n=1 Tax=Dinoponera quadriceps TaxID=609295 RepID=A0A6P3YBL5_DINQU|nr:PREDICTED: F-box/LRR-repeat protein 4 isoform X1 [Dinoponera quadriceps]